MSDPIVALTAQVSRLADVSERQLAELHNATEKFAVHKRNVRLIAVAVVFALAAVAGVTWHEFDERRDQARAACIRGNEIRAGVIDAVDVAVHEVAAELAADDGPDALDRARSAADRISGRVAMHEGLRLRDC